MNKQQAKEQFDKLMREAEALKKIIEAPEVTPEQRFAELILGLERKTDLENYPDLIFFFKKNDCWIEYDRKTNIVWLRHSTIWSVFEKEFNLNHHQIKELTKDMVEKHFGWKGVTTETALLTFATRWRSISDGRE